MLDKEGRAKYTKSDWLYWTMVTWWRKVKRVLAGVLGLLPWFGDWIVEKAGLYRTSHWWKLFDPDEQYAGLYEYSDVDVKWSGDDPPADYARQSLDSMRRMVPVHLRHLVQTVHLPAEKKSIADPMGQRGYIGWEYKPARQQRRIFNPITQTFKDVRI